MTLDLDMSPYGVFVWGAYALTAAVLAAVVIETVLSARRARRELERLEDEDRP